jgi:hypothetical protein
MPIFISEGTEFSTEMIKGLNEEFASPDRLDSENITVHVSDLVGAWCPLKPVMQRTHPHLYYLTEEDLNNFTRGKLSELAISKHMKEVMDSQKKVYFEGIMGRPDLVRKDNSIILELKDTNSFITVSPFNDDDIADAYQKAYKVLGSTLDVKPTNSKRKKYNSFPGYLVQLVTYMVMMDVEYGTVVIRHNNHKFIMKLKNIDISQSPFKEWKVHIPRDDPIRAKIKENLMIKKHFFVEAIKTKNIGMIPKCKDYYTEGPENVKCKRCCFKEECHKIKDTVPDYLREILDPLYIYNEFKNEIKIT